MRIYPRSLPATHRRRSVEHSDSDADLGTNSLRRSPPRSCRHATDVNREATFTSEPSGELADDAPTMSRGPRRRVVLSACRTQLAGRVVHGFSVRSRTKPLTTRFGRRMSTNPFSSDWQSYAESIASLVGKAPAAYSPNYGVPKVEIGVGRTLLPRVICVGTMLAHPSKFLRSVRGPR